MKVYKASGLFGVWLLSLVFAVHAEVFAQQISVSGPDEAVEVMRSHYLDRTYETGIREGGELIQSYPDLVELRAWYAAVLARNDQGEEAMNVASKLREQFPENPWSLFAYIRVLHAQDDQFDEALKLADELIAMDPDNHYFYWMKGVTLSNSGDAEATIEFINNLDKEFTEAKIIQSLLASSLVSTYAQSEEPEGKEKFQRGLEIYAELRSEDPEWVDAYYLPAFYLDYTGNKEKAYELIEEGAAKTIAPRVQSTYWRALMSNDELTRDEKVQKLDENMAFIQSEGPVSSDIMLGMAAQYGQLSQDEKERKLEERILNEFPESVNAEWVLVNRYRAFSRENREAIQNNEPKAVAQFEAMLWNFLERPDHKRDRLIGDAYRNLFYLYKMDEDREISSDTLLQVINGMAKYEDINVHITHAEAPIYLAEKTGNYQRAKELARKGMVLAEEKITQNNEYGAYENEEDFQRILNRYTAIPHDALGWIFYLEGKQDSARKYLSKAYSLHNENTGVMMHLGEYFENKGELGKAESYYTEAFRQKKGDRDSDMTKLKNLYIKRNGSEEGFDAYLTNLIEGGKTDRKQEVLGEAIGDPEEIASFDLKNLEGESMNSSSLKGKIVILNVWGTWCGPCVKEMPDIQKLHEKYKDDPEIVVLTINNDPDIGKVRDWMEEHEYTFEVLRDDGYLNANAVYVFPTTWFANTNTEIAFIQEGYTENLVEEFTWRVDYLSMSGE